MRCNFGVLLALSSTFTGVLAGPRAVDTKDISSEQDEALNFLEKRQNETDQYTKADKILNKLQTDLSPHEQGLVTIANSIGPNTNFSDIQQAIKAANEEITAMAIAYQNAASSFLSEDYSYGDNKRRSPAHSKKHKQDPSDPEPTDQTFAAKLEQVLSDTRTDVDLIVSVLGNAPLNQTLDSLNDALGSALQDFLPIVEATNPDGT